MLQIREDIGSRLEMRSKKLMTHLNLGRITAVLDSECKNIHLAKQEAAQENRLSGCLITSR